MPLKDATSGASVVVHQTETGSSSVATAFEDENYLSLEQQIANIADAGTEWNTLKAALQTSEDTRQNDFDAYVAGLADDLHTHPDARLVRLRTAGGQVTDFFRFNWITWAALRPDSAQFGTTTNVHEAFRDGSESSPSDHAYDYVYIAAYPLSLSNGEVVSQPGRAPFTGRTLDQAITYCAGTDIVGFEGKQRLWSIWDRSLVVNHVMGAGVNEPVGNTSYGADYQDPAVTGIYDDTGKTLAGSFGSVSSHTGESHGIYDLVGNVWEWCYGLETSSGRLKMITTNAASSTRAALVNHNKWISHVASSGGPEFVTSLASQNTYAGTSVASGGGGFNGFTANSSALLRRALVSGVTDSDNPRGGVWMTTTGDSALIVGGSWVNTSAAGLGALNLSAADDSSMINLGFRSAFAV